MNCIVSTVFIFKNEKQCNNALKPIDKNALLALTFCLLILNPSLDEAWYYDFWHPIYIGNFHIILSVWLGFYPTEYLA